MTAEIIGLVISLICAIAWTIACGVIAKRKKRSVVGWVFGGLFLGIIGLIIISCLPAKQ